MKIKFVKDVTVEVMCPETGTNDTYDRLMRKGVSVECHDVCPVSEGFSSLWVDAGEVLIDIRNDSFVQEP